MCTYYAVTQRIQVAKGNPYVAMRRKTEGVDTREGRARHSQCFELFQEIEYCRLYPGWSSSHVEDRLPRLATDDTVHVQHHRRSWWVELGMGWRCSMK